ncbi:MAG: hypothetical protein HY823_03240 [Acidobacteria bacterium]|nr:hypothetical protein [Acidobacteriota bacterium]
MKFEFNDETDQALVATLVHEMKLCNESFAAFLKYGTEVFINPNNALIKVKIHDAYSSFLHHLYEFYVGCIKRDRWDTKNIKHDELDQILTKEAQKQLKIKSILIENGIIDDPRNLPLFQVLVPETFGADFRRIRNRTAHASILRARPGNEISLDSFFKKYHFFVLILFYSGQFAWNIKNPETHDWGTIGAFNFGQSS